MKDNENMDVLAAFGIGALLGAGATLLLRPDEPTLSERIVRELKPMKRNAGKTAKRVAREYHRTAKVTRDATDELGDASRELIEDFTRRVNRIVSGARKDAKAAMRRKRRRRSLRDRLNVM